jgi:predicted transcriptional regulator
MSRTAFTLRIDAEERVALENLSRIEGRPMNQLLNEAIKGYLRQRGRKERSLEAHLASLRAYRKKDPGFRKAVGEFVEAEATLDDPLEGEILEVQPNEARAAGPVQSKIRDILGA